MRNNVTISQTGAGAPLFTLRDFETFIIHKPTSNNNMFASNATGFIGLGPYTTDGGDERNKSFSHILKEQGDIKENIVTYNITFNPGNNKPCSDSYIQIGDVSKYV